MTRKPCEPTPMKAMLTLSLGATCPTPPNTRRGTIEKPIAAAVCPKNLRRETEPLNKLRDRNRFFTVPPNLGCCSHCAAIDEPGYSKRTRGLHAKRPWFPLAADHEREYSEACFASCQP